MDFKISIDPTWDYVQITIWTTIELASGFASVCLPSIRQLLAAIIPASWKEAFGSDSDDESSRQGTERRFQGQAWGKHGPIAW